MLSLNDCNTLNEYIMKITHAYHEENIDINAVNVMKEFLIWPGKIGRYYVQQRSSRNIA